MKILTSFLLLVAMAGNSYAVKIIGGNDCGEWFENRTKAVWWLSGYLSGLNAANLNRQRDIFDAVNSPEQLHLWMDNYCKANPLNTVQQGANQLYSELIARLKQK